MSFEFAGPAEEFEGEESCGTCLEDYEVGMEVCRLPCNHLCCRSCTEKMFAIPLVDSDDHSKSDSDNCSDNDSYDDSDNCSDNDSYNDSNNCSDNDSENDSENCSDNDSDDHSDDHSYNDSDSCSIARYQCPICRADCT